MGQQQLMLTLGAIVLFSLVSLSVNRLVLNHTDAIYGQQAEFYAIKLAQRFIEEAKVKAFDENTINATTGSVNGFKLPPMGPEPVESYPNFDDVDDFNAFTTTLSTNIGAMTVSISVDYVQETNLDLVVATKTFYKKMSVTVQSDYLTSPVTAHYVFAFQKNQ